MAAKTVIVACVFACQAAVASAAKPLVLLTAAETPPFSYVDAKTGEVAGLEIDIAREAAEKLGRPLEVRKVDFPELLPAVSEGCADMASGLTITEGRQRVVDFSLPSSCEGGVFLYRAKDPVPTVASADLIKVATTEASTYDFYLVSHDIDPIRYESYAEAVEDLKAGIVDAVFYVSSAVCISAGESGGELSCSRMEFRENIAFAVQKGDGALKAALDDAIAARRKE